MRTQAGCRGHFLSWSQAPSAPVLYSAVLPSSRSVLTGSMATAFASVINAGDVTATGCGLALPPGFPGALLFQTTDAANALTGTLDTRVDIPAGKVQSFVFGIVSMVEMAAADIPLVTSCANTQPAASVVGLNRFMLSSSATAAPDILAIASTISNDGIVTVPVSGTSIITTASMNIGVASTLTIRADDGGRGLPIEMTLCRSNDTGSCLAGATPAASVRLDYAKDEIATFTVFVKATGPVAFDPAFNRIQIRWKSDDGTTRGMTSVAVRTQ